MINDSITSPEKLVLFVRDGLIEQEHFGFVVRCDREHVIEKMEMTEITLSICALVLNLFKLPC